MNLLFIRHAESFKSIEDRHGGLGLPLTEQGRIDVIELVSFLKHSESFDFDNSLFFCSDLTQVIETAKIIEEETHVLFNIVADLKNISLGILDGLSTEEAKRKYPDVAENLEKWRNGKIKINDFIIPQAETMQDFYSRIFNFINSIITKEKNVIIIGTRSVGVAITNIFRNYSSQMNKDNYQRYLFDPSSISKYSFENGKTNIDYINKTDFLKTKANHPDS